MSQLPQATHQSPSSPTSIAPRRVAGRSAMPEPPRQSTAALRGGRSLRTKCVNIARLGRMARSLHKNILAVIPRTVDKLSSRTARASPSRRCAGRRRQAGERRRELGRGGWSGSAVAHALCSLRGSHRRTGARAPPRASAAPGSPRRDGRRRCRPCRSLAHDRRVQRAGAGMPSVRRAGVMPGSASSRSMAPARSTVRENRACSGHSTRPWWLVAQAPAHDLGRPVGCQEGRRMVALAVDQGKVVGHVAGDAAQHLDRVAGALADLEQVAHDQRHAETGAPGLASAESQRRRRARPR